MYPEYSQTNNVTMVLVSRALNWFFFAFKIYRQWLKSQKNLALNVSILKLFFSAKSNLFFFHVVEWVDVNKVECWIFSCTFGIIFHLDHYSSVQHRFELSESWFMFLLSVSWQVKFCLTQIVTERNESWKQKMLNIFRPHVSH